jgi:hypothetical protein
LIRIAAAAFMSLYKKNSQEEITMGGRHKITIACEKKGQKSEQKTWKS